MAEMEETITPPSLHRICRRCNKELDLSRFPKRRGGKFGRLAKCKECATAEKAEWRANNASHDKAMNKAWRDQNRDRVFNQRQERYRDPTRWSQFAVTGCQLRAKKYNLVCTIAREDLDSKLGPGCPICTQVFDYSVLPDSRRNPQRPSPDRIDPSNGYTPDNVWIICWECNQRKRDADLFWLEATTKAIRAATKAV